ncbi:maleylpyruvate isomerase family mycothiol-dependent enzyme [Kitasatospora camelliae]|uniref:Maleylpyruvate isomerase family mycothiol-dependent enzyme n=1 Tax=Kitasatospora camelliae TaxID=3156397 RepID=A0AAU8JSP3_9ACTN
MKISEHLDALRRDGLLLADAADRTALDAPVPSCPEWRLRDLVLHTGQVHRWATAYVVDGHRQPLDAAGQKAAWGPEPADAELVGWFREGHGRLVAALEAAPEDLDCWSFLPAPSPLAFWARRQAHETAVHRIDAELAAGRQPTPVDAGLAEDGIDELLGGFMVRPGARVRSDAVRTLLVRPQDRPGAGWLVTVSREPLAVERTTGADADCTVTGTAHDLYLLLWNRVPATHATVTGDPAVLDLWRTTAHIRWS